MSSRRLKVVYFCAESVVKLLQDLGNDTVAMTPQIPADAKVVALERKDYAMYSRSYYNTMVMVLESKSFPDVPEGQEIPELPLIFTWKGV
jgi:hypothetical protein